MSSSYRPIAARRVATRQARSTSEPAARSRSARCSLRGGRRGERAQGRGREVGVVGQVGRHLGELLEPLGDPVARRPPLGQLQGDVEERLDHGRAVLASEHLEDAGEQVLAAELTVADHLEAGHDRERPVDRRRQVGRMVEQGADRGGVGTHGGEGEVTGVQQMEVGLGEADGRGGAAGLHLRGADQGEPAVADGVAADVEPVRPRVVVVGRRGR